MQNLKSCYKFYPEKECLKFKDRETKGERGTMYFQIALSLIFTFSSVILCT